MSDLEFEAEVSCRPARFHPLCRVYGYWPCAEDHPDDPRAHYWQESPLCGTCIRCLLSKLVGLVEQIHDPVTGISHRR